MSTGKEAPRSKFISAFAAVLYGVVSISITFFNKAVLSAYDYPYSNVLTLGQMVCAVIFLVLFKNFKLIDYPSFNTQTAKKAAPLAIAFIAMVVTGLASLGKLSVPMYTALRRSTTLVVMVLEYFMLKKVSSKATWATVALMNVGAAVAAAGDFEFNLEGYVIVFLNGFATAAYLVAVKKVQTATNLRSFGLMLYNNLLSIPFMLLIVMATGEHEGAFEWKHWADMGFVFCFVMSAAQAFLLNYAIFFCTEVNSALTTSITGQMKNIITTLAGLFAFGGVVINTLNLLGLFLSTAASILYAYVKYNESLASQKAKAAAEDEENAKEEEGKEGENKA
mmetsp:Transcript_50079/g.128902  ORF Transcript_50079/g.128902 Transcript_50079/m.128902 type:complete len:336 (-) Transcript_50079:33-1040(-)|eukprot:CAMPEP_0113880074 /NCGR_PEP_ID=MMETSP0780_2-20120614/7588_1 /TAXON_ID=652834 /ORGANISM="Palpitomonas bilix" /LENGTH=335 /DNA_ID=CAMNT_0000866719 /DNA_START=187 /DNA_END=1194 /DNA_ORIENTATION=- /assembly_acc=CAM_ASM_000599